MKAFSKHPDRLPATDVTGFLRGANIAQRIADANWRTVLMLVRRTIPDEGPERSVQALRLVDIAPDFRCRVSAEQFGCGDPGQIGASTTV